MSYRTDVNAGRIGSGPHWTQQNWTDQTWTIVATDVSLGEFLWQGGPARFRLESGAPEGGAATYMVQPEVPGELPVPLRACRLIVRGSEPLAPLSGTLPTYFEGARPAYHDASEKVISDADSRDVLRLEGRVRIGGEDHRIRLYQAENAIEGGKSLLVLWVPPQGRANPDGSAIGHN
ncbi:MAG TPA: hypothetical protein VLX90_03955 [Steroidobacteraceae bacterium]|nr:hypothetical protein [Steroidobacteraceae bacterium]